MTERVITPAQLPLLAGDLLSGHHVVALTINTTEHAWACQTAWATARAAAVTRRVLLIDLSDEGPGLDTRTTGATTRGITDVFEDGGALEDVARDQGSGLHYIGRGAAGGPGATLWSSERWQRLARGFSSEDALLLLFVPPPALRALPIPELSILVLTAQGHETADGGGPIGQRLAAGAPLIGTVARSLVPARTSGRVRTPVRARSLTGAGMAGVVAVLALAVAWSRGSSADQRTDTRLTRPLTIPGPATPPADSLYYSVQVAAYNTLPEALAQAGAIEAQGRTAVISPARLGPKGTWYRVLVDALPTARAADSLLQVLWDEGGVERPQGTILRTPDTYRVRGSRGDIPALRARGVPAYIVLAPDSTEQVFVGAFDLAEQARLTDSLLAAADLSGTLVRRTGSPP